jgi:hypothetical protein
VGCPLLRHCRRLLQAHRALLCHGRWRPLLLPLVVVAPLLVANITTGHLRVRHQIYPPSALHLRTVKSLSAPQFPLRYPLNNSSRFRTTDNLTMISLLFHSRTLWLARGTNNPSLPFCIPYHPFIVIVKIIRIRKSKYAIVRTSRSNDKQSPSQACSLPEFIYVHAIFTYTFLQPTATDIIFLLWSIICIQSVRSAYLIFPASFPGLCCSVCLFYCWSYFSLLFRPKSSTTIYPLSTLTYINNLPPLSRTLSFYPPSLSYLIFPFGTCS